MSLHRIQYTERAADGRVVRRSTRYIERQGGRIVAAQGPDPVPAPAPPAQQAMVQNAPLEAPTPARTAQPSPPAAAPEVAGLQRQTDELKAGLADIADQVAKLAAAPATAPAMPSSEDIANALRGVMGEQDKRIARGGRAPRPEPPHAGAHVG